MPVQLGVRPSPDFNDPLGLMSDCHRRIEHFLEMLIRVAREPSEPLSENHREALDRALRYFRAAAPKHTQDEEQSLFPRLREAGESATRQAVAQIEALEADHQRADAAHAEVDAIGSQWLASGKLESDSRARILRLLEELRSMYRRHIEVEDREVFPLAERVLSSEQLSAVGQEMADRRGVRR